MSAESDAQRLVLRGGGSAALGYLVRFAARLIFLYLAARLFGVALFGAYSLAIAAVELAVAVGGLGMKRYLFQLLEERATDRHPAHVLIDAALLVTGASLVLAAATMGAAALLPASLLAPNTAAALLIVAPMIAGQALLDLFLAATRWSRRMRYEVAARSLVEPYVGIAAAAAAFTLGYDVTGLAISYWAGTLAALGYAWWGVRSSFGGFAFRAYRLDPARLAATARSTALPAATDLIAGLFARLDLYLVGIFLGERSAGIYAMARQIRTPVRQVRQSFDGMLTPLLARTLARRGPRATGIASASATRLMLAIQLPIVLALFIVGRPLLDWLGPEFSPAYWPLVVLALAETILAAFGVSDLILLYRRAALGLAVTGASIAVNIAATWLLIGPLGLDGAALAVLIAVASGALIRRLLLRSSFGISLPIRHCVGPALAGLAAIVPALALRPIMPMQPTGAAIVTLVVALAVYGAVLALWRKATGQALSLENLQAA